MREWITAFLIAIPVVILLWLATVYILTLEV